MKSRMMYVEHKSHQNDKGSAWIGRVFFSKTGRTLYFNGMAFQSLKGSGGYANYYEMESGEEYWISGVKKSGGDRHWAGSGIIAVGRDVVDEYLATTGWQTLPASQFVVVDIEAPQKNV